MKTYEERTTDILKKARLQRRKRNIIHTGIACIFILGIILFIPYNTTPPSVERYAASDYYSIIEKMNKLTYSPPYYKNAFEQYVLEPLDSTFFPKSTSCDDLIYESTEAEMPGDSASGQDKGFTDVTDNQVDGIIEGDRFKRGDNYIYYLKEDGLAAYSIAGDASGEVGYYRFSDADGFKLFAYADQWEIFLTEDQNTVLLISSGYNPHSGQTCVVLVSIDVSHPAQMKERQRTYLTGSYLSARMTGNELLLIAQYNPRWSQIDFSDESTFIPQYGTLNNSICIDAEHIIAPEELTSSNYTVVCKIDAATLEAKSTGAFLSYAKEVYVSKDTIYATRTFTGFHSDTEEGLVSQSMTEITAINYRGEDFVTVGSIQIPGMVKNQYSLDEYEGILRVVTTTSKRFNYSSETNAGLYCIDLNTWELVASVEDFAPMGETVQSVRFDKDYAYVCTAVQIQFTDPVYYFDLSDLNHITYKDTGTIAGYSSSLVNFGGYLLGIGYGDSIDTLKIELYQETPEGVEAVCSYEVERCSFSTEYKSYLIDRDHMRIGLGYYQYGAHEFDDCYVLLQFDGYGFIELVKAPLGGENAYKRATVIDGYLYMFGDNFIVKKL